MSKTRKIVLAVLLVIAAILVGIIAHELTQRAKAKKSYDDVREIAFATTEATTITDNTVATTLETTEEIDTTEVTNPSIEVVYESPVDFVELQKINPEIYAWIEIEGANISYPILQRKDDYLYYLNHTYDYTENRIGSIFTEGFARHDFMDPVTIIYGHNLKSREMFGNLREYRDAAYMEENRYITIYTPTATLTYKIFASVTYSNVLISSKYDITTLEGAQGFIDSINDLRNISNVFMDDVDITTVTEEDHIIALSTCNNNSEQRFLVLAILVEE